MSSTIVISHSEVDSFLQCEQRHFYGFGDRTHGELAGLEPLHKSESLYRGIVGHAGLAASYKVILDGGSFNEATEAGINAVNEFSLQPYPMFNVLTDLNSRILPRYWNNLKSQLEEGWRPLAVEKEFRLAVNLSAEIKLVYPFRPDVIMRDRAGNTWVWDHKFVYNFYTPSEIDLLPQIPKYIGALRANGFTVTGGYYNQLRWREVKDLDNHVRLEPFKPTNERVKNAFRQQVRIMLEIGKRKAGMYEEWRDNNLRVLNQMICRSCSFKGICARELNGNNTELTKRVDFRANTYGYDEVITP